MNEQEENTSQVQETEVPIINLQEHQESQATDPNINPETGKPFTQNEKNIILLNKFCMENGIQMQQVAQALSQSLQKQIRLFEKERDYFKTEMERHRGKVEYKELLAREVKAQEIIDKHHAEIDKYNKMFVEATVTNLTLNAKTDAEKETAKKVAEFAGYKFMDIEMGNKAEVDKRAKSFADEMFASWKSDALDKIKLIVKERDFDNTKNVI